MARPLRIEYIGAWYHVMNRGTGRRRTFPDDALRREFLRLLGDLHDTYAVYCHAYCLMGNHYHLLVQTGRANLGRAMRHLDGVYTQRHNRHLKTDGPLFRGRYKAIVIERDRYLLRVSRYIHRNPLAAGLCDQLVEYPWSSYPVYAGLRPAPPWLHRHDTLAGFASVSEYCAFVELNEDDELTELHSGKTFPPALGSQGFVDACRAQLRSDFDYEIPQAKALSVSVTLDDIIDTVSARVAISRPDLIAASDHRTRAARAMAMMLCRRCGGFKLRDIADAFGIARYTTVASAISRLGEKARQDADVAREIEILHMQINKMRNT